MKKETDEYPVKGELWKTNIKGMVYEILHLANASVATEKLPVQVVFKRIAKVEVYSMPLQNFLRSAKRTTAKKVRKHCKETGQIRWTHSET